MWYKSSVVKLGLIFMVLGYCKGLVQYIKSTFCWPFFPLWGNCSLLSSTTDPKFDTLCWEMPCILYRAWLLSWPCWTRHLLHGYFQSLRDPVCLEIPIDACGCWQKGIGMALLGKEAVMFEEWKNEKGSSGEIASDRLQIISMAFWFHPPWLGYYVSFFLMSILMQWQ